MSEEDTKAGEAPEADSLDQIFIDAMGISGESISPEDKAALLVKFADLSEQAVAKEPPEGGLGDPEPGPTSANSNSHGGTDVDGYVKKKAAIWASKLGLDENEAMSLVELDLPLMERLTSLERENADLKKQVSSQGAGFKWQQAKSRYPNATASDESEARKLVSSGKINDPEMALEFVMRGREPTTVKPKTRLSKDTILAAVEAAKQSANGAVGGQAPIRLDGSRDSLRDFFRHQAEAS